MAQKRVLLEFQETVRCLVLFTPSPTCSNHLETDSELFKELCDGDINVERLLTLTRGAGFNIEQTDAEAVIAKTIDGLSYELNEDELESVVGGSRLRPASNDIQSALQKRAQATQILNKISGILQGSAMAVIRNI